MSTAYMNLTLPTPSVTDGPTWAEENNTALETIDAHDHSPGKGVPVPSAGLNIDDDLDIGNNKLENVKSVALENQSSSMSAANVQSVYSISGDLWYNNSSGTPVQITQGNSIASASSPLVPSGVIWSYGGSSAPTGFLICDGTAVSRTTYSDLFAAIGTTYGVGNGTTTFNLPNLIGRTPIGAGTYIDSVSGSVTRTLGSSLGAEKHQLTTSELASHTHTQNPHTHTADGTHTGASSGVLYSGTGTTLVNTGSWNTGSTTATNQNTGGDVAHNNMQPSLVTNWIIKT